VQSDSLASLQLSALKPSESPSRLKTALKAQLVPLI
jgi:hypothetical protein